jgi:hypothetical protein
MPTTDSQVRRKTAARCSDATRVNLAEASESI